MAVVGVGGLVAPSSKGGKIVRLAYSSVAPTPVRVFEAEKVFEKSQSLDELLDEAIPIVKRAVSPISDVRAARNIGYTLSRC